VLPVIATLRRTWQRHYDRTVDERAGAGGGPAHAVRFKTNRDDRRPPRGFESPYDADARYRHKRDTQWTGYMVHVSETCEPTTPHLLTNVHRPQPRSMKRSAPRPSSRRSSTRTSLRGNTWSMQRISARHYSSTAATNRDILLRGPTAPARGGRRRSKALTPWSSSRWTGTAAGTLPPRPPVYRVVGAWGWAGQSPHHCGI